MGKRLFIIAVCFIAAVILSVFLPSFFFSPATIAIEQNGVIQQSVISVNQNSQVVYRLYVEDEYIGTLKNDTKLEEHLIDVYHEEYEQQYPNSSCHLGNDVYLVQEQTYNVYSDIDDHILAYLDQNHLYSIESTAVSFSDMNGTYAEIYVSDEALFRESLQEYTSFFVDKETLEAIQKDNKISDITTYGTKIVDMYISETITYSKKNVAPKDIKTNKDEMLEYLEYGENTNKEYYIVQDGDTLAGIGLRYHGLSPEQLVNINPGKLTSVDQIPTRGIKLCVTYFNSPIDIVVTKQKLQEEEIDYLTVRQQDSSLPLNQSQVIQMGMKGSRNALYEEKWINGILTSGSLQSSMDTQQPIDEVIITNQIQIDSIGTGTYRFPVDNPKIICEWGCYYGHEFVDFANQYDPWGNVYAVDTGTVIEEAYDPVNGNYIKIDHHNGMVSYYGCLRDSSVFEVGDTVEKGQVIGNIGMTGEAKVPHVAFYMQQNDQIIDACQVNGFPSCQEIKE